MKAELRLRIHPLVMGTLALKQDGGFCRKSGAAEGDDFPERFQDQSAYYQSAGLADPLTIIHGTKDQVVLYADTMALAQKMIQQGKDFNIVSLPGVGHAWDAHDLPTTRFAFHKLADFFDSVLQPEKQ